MRRYETIVILDPELSEEQRVPLFEKLDTLIPEYDGLLVMREVWGTQKLAYEIKKKTRGYYVRFDYCGAGALADEIERAFRIDDRVLKYMTVLLEKQVDLDSIKEEMAQAEKAEKAVPAETSPASDTETAEPETAESPATENQSIEKEEE